MKISGSIIALGIAAIAGFFFLKGRTGKLRIVQTDIIGQVVPTYIGRAGNTFQIQQDGFKTQINQLGHAIWPVKYGWKELNFMLFVYSADGEANVDFVIDSTTPPRVYTIYLDQRPWGGPYYEAKFEVLP